MNSKTQKMYEEKMTGPFFFPRIMIDNNTFKPGLYFFDNEALRNFSVMGGFAMNSPDSHTATETELRRDVK